MKMSREQYGDLKIVQYGHPALRQKAAPVRRSFEDLTELVERMMSLTSPGSAAWPSLPGLSTPT